MGYSGVVGTLVGTTDVQAVAGVVTFSGVAAIPLAVTTQFKFTVIETGTTVAPLLSSTITVLANSTVPPYDWKGFSGDVDDPPSVNKVEAGDDQQIRFSLNGNKGLEIFADGYPATQAASCTTWAVSGAITPIKVRGTWDNDDDDDDDDYVYDHDYDHCSNKSHHQDHRHKVSHGSNWSWGSHSKTSTHSTTSSNDAIKSALRYDGGKYKLDWDTDRAWKNTCRVLLIKLVDGTTHKAYFKFTD